MATIESRLEVFAMPMPSDKIKQMLKHKKAAKAKKESTMKEPTLDDMHSALMHTHNAHSHMMEAVRMHALGHHEEAEHHTKKCVDCCNDLKNAASKMKFKY